MEELAGASLLPALALTPANPALAGEVWALLKLLPYTTRWRLYGRLKARCSTSLGFFRVSLVFCVRLTDIKGDTPAPVSRSLHPKMCPQRVCRGRRPGRPARARAPGRSSRCWRRRRGLADVTATHMHLCRT